MKYCIKFYQGCRVLADADEIIINYYEKDAELIKFLDDIEDDKRLILNILELDEINKRESLEIFAAAALKHSQMAILTTCDETPAFLSFCKEHDIDYFFCENVDNLDTLHEFINKGVSDVYIVNELGFRLQAIGDYCHENNVNVRVYPNIAQTCKYALDSDAITKFFIRPEDSEYYENYIDVIEFFGAISKQPVLYDIYTSREWIGDISSIIIGLNDHLDNQTFMPHFGLSRLNCGKRCNLGKCNSCYITRSLCRELSEKNLGVKL